MLHALRQSTRRTGRLLLPLLLLSWLSMVCGHCVAFAGEFEAGLAHHEPPIEAGHDCCPQADPCIGADCEHPADVAALSAGTKLGDHPPALVASVPVPARPFLAAEAIPLAATPPGPPPPLYLRNCVFLI